MKPYFVAGLVLLSFFGAKHAGAQPAPAAQGQQALINGDFVENDAPLEWRLGREYNAHSPLRVVIDFIENSNYRLDNRCAFLVSGVDYESPAIDELMNYLTNPQERLRWQVLRSPDGSDETAKAVPENATEITIPVQIGIIDDIGLSLVQTEQVALRREKTAGGPVWRIVSDAEPFSLSESWSPKAQPGIVRTLASYLAQPEKAVAFLKARRAMRQSKAVGLALMQFVQDYNETFLFTEANFLEKIRPYLGPGALSAPLGLPKGTPGININPALVGQKIGEIRDPSQVVALYFGEDEQIGFPFEGKSVVTYVDGHVGLVDAEQAKTLRWAIQ
jgi:hypothetical protein